MYIYIYIHIYIYIYIHIWRSVGHTLARVWAMTRAILFAVSSGVSSAVLPHQKSTYVHIIDFKAEFGADLVTFILNFGRSEALVVHRRANLLKPYTVG